MPKVEFAPGFPTRGAATEFTDDFNRAGPTLGTNWISKSEFAGPNYMFSLAANRLVVTETGNSGQFFTACLGAPGLIAAASQYAEVQIIARTNTPRWGPSVFMAAEGNNGVAFGSRMQGYFCITALDALVAQLGWINTPANQVLVTVPASFALAANDVVGIQVDIGATSNRVRAFRNGVLQIDFTHTAATRPLQAGIPGLYGSGSAPAATWTVDNFACRRTQAG